MNIDELSYEEAILKLEDLIAIMDGEELSLDQYLESFEAAVKLHNHCNKLLSNMQDKINIVLSENKISQEDFLEG